MSDFATLRVVIADDHDHIRKHTRSLLAEHGITPVVCSDGQECIEALAAGACDLLLLDMQMPRLDGAAVLQWLNSLPGPRPHVVVVTTTLRGKSRFLDLGAADVLPKPLTRERLAQVLAEVAARQP